SIVEATIASWLKHEGDAVRSGEALVELETDKVNVEVTAEQDGVLQQIIKHDGDEVTVGEVLGLIGAGEQAAPAAPASNASHANGQTSPGADATSLPHTDLQRPPSPLARRIAAEYNVDLSQVQGTSPHGRVTKEDVINYMEQTRVPTQALPVVASA